MEIPLLKEWLRHAPKGAPDLYLVGGAVRDIIMGKAPKDVDIACTGAKEFARRLARALNLALVPMEKKADEPCYRVADRENSERFLDIAELRGGNIGVDLKRRDFTINAIAVSLDPDGSPGDIIDPLDGAGDIQRKIVRVAGEGSISSDPVRILRAFRFCAQLGFFLDPATVESIRSSAPLLHRTAAERIMAELLLILSADGSAQFCRMMDEFGVLEVIFPEIGPMKGCEQNGFHHLDVWEHSLLVMETIESILGDAGLFFGEMERRVNRNLAQYDRLAMLKLAALLHDVGKPSTRGFNPIKERNTFYHHAEKGSAMVLDMAERLRMPGRNRDLLALLVAEHRHVHDLSKKNVNPATVMRWFRKLGDDAIPAIILSMADSESKKGPASSEQGKVRFRKWCKWRVEMYYTELKKKLDTPSLINGRDLMDLGLEQGPEIGYILRAVRDAQDLDEVTDRAGGLALAKELIARRRQQQ